MAYSSSNNGNMTVSTFSGKNARGATYKGFSTVAGVKSNQLYDLDIIKQDLLNHFYTRKGERVMNPEFGSIIWDMLYEPMDEATQDEIREDTKRIINSDPRVQLESTKIDEFENGLVINVTMNTIPFNKRINLQLDFEKETL
jgi:phage baseplate assembly protein W|tara:strand:- start:155 stop:580 length:426 start_codon:yes stop_codon:yes gene_type:complete